MKAIIVLAAVLALLAPATASAAKFALLVGVGDYDDAAITDLRAPANDVSLMAGVVQRLGVSVQDIMILATSTNPKLSPLKSAGRPTRAAIFAALEQMARRVKAGDQAMIYITSHGTQQPDQPVGQPQNDETDGLDEVILPADASHWDQATGTVRNGIVDDEIGTYVDEIRRKGATVWLVVDACHSGTALRGAEPQTHPRRQEKYVAPADLGIPVQRGAVSPAPTIETQDGRLGSVTAFYAVQPGERALSDVWKANGVESDHEFSLLTFALATALQDGTARSYRDLAQRLTGVYRQQSAIADRFPQFEGEFNRALLGDGFVRPQAWDVSATAGQFALQGGTMDFLSEGSIVRVTNLRLPDQMGPFRIVRAGATTATLQPVGGFDPASMLADPNRQLRAELVTPAVALGVRVRVDGEDSPFAYLGRRAARALAARPEQGISLVQAGEQADIVLYAGPDRIWIARGDTVALRFNTEDRLQPRYVSCAQDAADLCLQRTTEALTLLARGQRLEAILGVSTDGGVAGNMRVESLYRHFETRDGTAACRDFIAPTANESFTPAGPDPLSPAGIRLGNCDQVWLRVTNTGTQALDVTPIHLAVDGTITILSSDTQRDEDLRIMPGQTRQYYTRIRTTSPDGGQYPVGPENVMLIAVEQPASMSPRTYRWLATPGAALQRGGGEADVLTVSMRAAEQPNGAQTITAVRTAASEPRSTVVRIPIDLQVR